MAAPIPANPIRATGALIQTAWPREPEGFEYRFCLPSSPVVHFLRERITCSLVAFRIQNGQFVELSALAEADGGGDP